jgi:tetratricopeptide (TPR) repeat protein
LDYNAAIEIDPKDAGFYLNRGNFYVVKGEYDQAISDYTRAIEIKPEYVRAYYNRGTTYYSKKEYGKSWEDIKKAQALGYTIPAKFLDDLRKASGRQN